ncbi:potassium transporter TrkG, partial [Vibrio alginolyticus]
ITHLAAFICLTIGRTAKFKLSVRDMFLITSLVWTIASAFAALPFVFINHISFTDAYFETMSGITTTGSTVLSGLDNMAPSILLWRSILQWLGGIGFIVMAVAVLPMLNVGGMKLFQTESSDWSDKSSPRAKTVAKNIVAVYLMLTGLCILGYLITGMNLFEAINHAFTTLSTGGYSTS